MDILEKILNADAGIDIDLPLSWRYKTLRFDHELERGKMMYTWSLEYRHDAGYDYPMKNSNYVKYFKTIQGAKRNVIKHLGFLLESK